MWCRWRIPARNQGRCATRSHRFFGVGKPRGNGNDRSRGVRQVNVESEPEMVLLDKVARAHGKNTHYDPRESRC